MALYYTLQYNAPHGQIDHYDWHVGNDTSHLNDLNTGQTCTVIQADGHELEHIRDHFENIPWAKNVWRMEWRGDIATFIARHLRN